MKTVISSSTPSPCCESWNACAVPEKFAGDASPAASARATRLTAATAAPRLTRPAARLNEIVTDASCPECATLCGPVAPLEVRDVGQRHQPAARARARRACVERVRVHLRARHESASRTQYSFVARVDRGRLLLAVRVRERALDRQRRHAEHRGAVAVDAARSPAGCCSAGRVVTSVSSGVCRSLAASCCALA